jgi:hypothetical protein
VDDVFFLYLHALRSTVTAANVLFNDPQLIADWQPSPAEELYGHIAVIVNLNTALSRR